MRVRSYLITLISIVGLGACFLIGGLTYAYQDLENEREKRALSAEALDSLKYVKEDLNRLTTLGDLIFGATQGLNSYLAKPASSQIAQIEGRLDKLKQKALTLDSVKLEQLTNRLSELQVLFKQIHQGKIDGGEYDRYDQSSFAAIKEFRGIYKASKQIATDDAKSLEQQKATLEYITWIASLAYLVLIALLTWWSNWSISKPVATLSRAATASLEESEAFPLSDFGPIELRSLGEILHRLINQLESEVAKKTHDLQEENRERRAAEAKLRVLNERQRALVEASVRFVPRPFLEFLGHSDLTLVERGDSTRQQLGILFSDLRGFTSLAESKSPQEIFDLLNRYLDAVVPSIHDNHGFVDKYIGDAIMALFPHKAEKAVQAAIDMFHHLYDFVNRDEVQLSMGVGIHWGEVILGTLGSSDRWESTVIGDTVNLAARLEGMTKAYSCPLIISDSLVDALPTDHSFTLRPLDLVRVKGRLSPVTIYEVIDAHPSEVQAERRSVLELSIEGFQQYREGEIEKAVKTFEELQEVVPSDPLAEIFLKRLHDLITEGLPSEWSGVYTHTTK